MNIFADCLKKLQIYMCMFHANRKSRCIRVNNNKNATSKRPSSYFCIKEKMSTNIRTVLCRVQSGHSASIVFIEFHLPFNIDAIRCLDTCHFSLRLMMTRPSKIRHCSLQSEGQLVYHWWMAHLSKHKKVVCRFKQCARLSHAEARGSWSLSYTRQPAI